MAAVAGGSPSRNPCSCTRRSILYSLLLCTLLVIFLTHQLAPFGGSSSSFFQIQNFIHIGFFYDDYENSNSNTGDSVYKTLPLEPGALCNIPSIDPFDTNALRLIAGDEEGKQPVKCMQRERLVKFYPANDGSLVRVNTMAMEEYWKTVKCCYIGYWGHGNPGNESSPACEPVAATVTPIPAKYDFVNVKCFRINSSSATADYQDQFEFFRLKSEHRKRKQQEHKPPRPPIRKPNVLFIGLDSVSHVHFIRSFPKSHQFLMERLGAVEFFGHNKISTATQGNVLAMLTGCKLEQNSQIPELLPAGLSCDLVWNKFRKNGYTVLRAEDDFGLNNQFFPTLRTERHFPLTDEQISDYRWTGYLGEMKRINTAKANQYTFGCFDHQWVQDLLFDRMFNVAEAFHTSRSNARPYFHFTWSATTAHDVIGYARYLDDPLYRLLTRLGAKQLLNNAVLILASDHGMAYGTYSRTNAGSIESRMPLLYFVFPDWLRNAPHYSEAMANLKTNALRLTTQFDLHETLLDLADLGKITNSALEHHSSTRLLPKLSRNKGQSLFLPVPVNRTCESAGIPEEWCICWTKAAVENPAADVDIQAATKVALQELNAHLRPFARCSQLKLDSIETARHLSSKLVQRSSYEIVFRTQPGGALYEVSVAEAKGRRRGSFRVLGDIVRVNAYGERGACLEEYEKKSSVPYLVNSACHCNSKRD